MADVLGLGWDDDEDEDDPVMRAARLAAKEAEQQASRANSETYRYGGGDSSSEVVTPEEAAEAVARRQRRRKSGEINDAGEVVFHPDPRGGFVPPDENVSDVQQRYGSKPAGESKGQPQTPKPPGSRIAKDGQTLGQQSMWTQTAFRHQYGERAEEEWVRQHEAELDKNIRYYGVQEPTAGTAPVSGAPSGIGAAPDRRIGAVSPPNPVSPVEASTAAPAGGSSPTPRPAPIRQAGGATNAPTTFGTTAPPTASEDPNELVAVRSKINKVDLWLRRSEVRPDLYEPIDPNLPSLPPKPVNPAPWIGSQSPPPAPPTPTSVQATADDDAISQVIDSDKPIDGLVRLGNKSPEESKRVLDGIGALVRGDSSGAWTEPYLNDTARLAWAKQERAQGRNVDPRDAPQSYIESWKDAFFGSDHSVPMVKELDQQMIDAAVDRSQAQRRPFDWREAFGSTGENGLISTQVASNDCGPNAFATVLRSKGYNADPASAFTYAKSRGYHNGEEFTGPYNMARMLSQEAGLKAQAIPMDWSVVDQELAQGRVVVLSSRGHYWAVSARRDGPNGPEYYAGATASVVGNPEWSRPGALRYGGAPDTMIVTSGDVDPNSRVVQTLALKPPTGSEPDRQLLSMSTRQQAEQKLTANVTRNMANRTQATGTQGANDWSQIVWDLTVQENEANPDDIYVDPVLIQAITGQESGNNPNTPDSYMGARGPMQLMGPAAAEVGVNRDDPIDNTRGGIRYFKKMLKRYDGNVEMALAAYNAGPGAVDQYGGIPPFAETQKYVPAVLGRYRDLQKMYAGMP